MFFKAGGSMTIPDGADLPNIRGENESHHRERNREREVQSLLETGAGLVLPFVVHCERQAWYLGSFTIKKLPSNCRKQTWCHTEDMEN